MNNIGDNKKDTSDQDRKYDELTNNERTADDEMPIVKMIIAVERRKLINQILHSLIAGRYQATHTLYAVRNA